MANVKFNEKTYYVPSEKFLVGVKQHCNVYKDPSTSSKKVASVEENQVFSVSSKINDMYRIKLGWLENEACDILKGPTNEVIELAESFVVKIISNIPVFTEPSMNAHTATVLRIGDVERVVGESEDFFKLEHGGYIEKRGCRRY